MTKNASKQNNELLSFNNLPLNYNNTELTTTKA